LLAFIRQKRRHISSSKAYARPQQIAYMLYHLSNLMLWLSPFFAGIAGIGVLLMKFFADGLIFRQALRQCRLPVFWPAFLPWEALFLATHLVAGPSAFVGRIKWK
jgi:hypothetical protein